MSAWLGVHEVMAAFDRVVAEAAAEAEAIVVESAAVVEAAAKANFEGAHRRGDPHVGGDKPNVVTGTLRRSIRHDRPEHVGLAEVVTRVYPSTVYARRVELGFTGTDSAGRSYSQPPYPYFTPAVEDNYERLEAIARAHWSRLSRR